MYIFLTILVIGLISLNIHTKRQKQNLNKNYLKSKQERRNKKEETRKKKEERRKTKKQRNKKEKKRQQNVV